MTVPNMAGRPLEQPMGIGAPAIVWMAVHGYLCLALRDPGTAELDSRAYIEQFVAQLGADLVDRKVLTPEELAEIEDIEVRIAGRCELCGCSEEEPCPSGCAWDPIELLAGRHICLRCTGRSSLEEL